MKICFAWFSVVFFVWESLQTKKKIFIAHYTVASFWELTALDPAELFIYDYLIRIFSLYFTSVRTCSPSEGGGDGLKRDLPSVSWVLLSLSAIFGVTRNWASVCWCFGQGDKEGSNYIQWKPQKRKSDYSNFARW